MAFRLKPGLAFCFVDEKPVFLDVCADRYFMLGADLAKAFRQVAAGEQAPDMFLKQLQRMSILESAEGAPPQIVPPEIHRPSCSAFSMSGGETRGPTISGVIDAYRLLLANRRRLRRHGFARCIARMGEQKQAVTAQKAPSDPFVVSLAASFRRARALIPIEPNCLIDSLALADFLHERSAWADLVIGVRADPFAAHSWVQTRTALLNEEFERASQFTPILVT